MPANSGAVTARVRISSMKRNNSGFLRPGDETASAGLAPRFGSVAARLGPAGPAGNGVFEQRHGERALAVEEVINRACGGAGCLADIVDRCGDIALFEE